MKVRKGCSATAVGLAWLFGGALSMLACQPPNSPEQPSPSVSTSPSPSVSTSPSPSVSTSPSPSVSTSPVASAPSTEGSAEAAAAVASKRPPPPAPSLASCEGTFPNPECWSHFPAKVECPAQFADVPVGSYCGLEGQTQAPAACRYVQATCKCKHLEYCGGVTPTQLQQMGMTWACAPPRGPADCPEAAAPGQRCVKPGQTCDYGSCGSATHCSCLGANAAHQPKGPYFSCQTSMRTTPP
jgi:hypothetical protein